MSRRRKIRDEAAGAIKPSRANRRTKRTWRRQK